MSYYDFEKENFARVSDSEWKKRVENRELPPRPFWTDSFLYPPAEWITPLKGDLIGDDNVTAADAAIALRFAARGRCRRRSGHRARCAHGPASGKPRGIKLRKESLRASAELFIT